MCINFICVLVLGDNTNIIYINSLLDFNTSFEMNIINYNNSKNYIKNITKRSGVLIPTRIYYNNRIYYAAINDVRNVINYDKPMLLYGYDRGVAFYEVDNKLLLLGTFK